MNEHVWDISSECVFHTSSFFYWCKNQTRIILHFFFLLNTWRCKGSRYHLPWLCFLLRETYQDSFTLSMLGKISRRYFETMFLFLFIYLFNYLFLSLFFYFLFFNEKSSLFQANCLPRKETICMKCQTYFFGGKRSQKVITSLSYAEFV